MQNVGVIARIAFVWKLTKQKTHAKNKLIHVDKNLLLIISYVTIC